MTLVGFTKRENIRRKMQNDNLKLKIDTSGTLPEMEQAVLKFWQENNIFKKSLEERKGREKYTFYDGPPFANGLPHYGHILAMSIKDLFVRYETMRGYYVPRRNGWDTHGLPVEYQLEKELGISGKKAIEEYGIAKFNKAARRSVMKYADVWRATIERMGRWVDNEHAYKTYEPSYIESVWWVFKKLWDKDLVSKDFAVQPYCPRCETALSNFETNQGYKDHTPDPSVFVKFAVEGKGKDYFLVWTTTPWTLPANVALAINPKLKYGLYESKGEKYWLARELSDDVLGREARLIETKTGKDLVGMKYQPIFPEYFEQVTAVMGSKTNAHKVLSADFVTLDEGTGIVHIAPAYGEDDMKLARREQLPVIFSCDARGRMLTVIAKGLFIKSADRQLTADLKKRELIFKAGVTRHTYPFCWRCDTPLIYMAMSAWFIKVTALQDELIKLNQKTTWQPKHLRDGRFGKWLEGVRDWNIGRLRYWGAPMPIWECDNCQSVKVVDKISELGKGGDFDPHRPQIDEVTFACGQCRGGTMKRVPEVFDCWFESGSMPYAQWHYPFENKQEFEEDFPADFIAEGIDQTRGWFYTLHVLATALFGKPAYRNVVANGIVQAEDGQKLSKKLRNYPEPSEIFDELGADALRQYLFSATQIGEDYRFSKRLVAEESRKVVLPLWNSLIFYQKYLSGAMRGSESASGDILDRWILARIDETFAQAVAYLDDYDITRAARAAETLISDLSQWYLRLSRKRKDKNFSQTLRRILKLTAILVAPFMPFVAEAVYAAVRNEDDPTSVHLEIWPTVSGQHKQVLSAMARVRELVETGHRIRAEKGIKVRQPLGRMNYQKAGDSRLTKVYEVLLLQELNILKIDNDFSCGDAMVALDVELNSELRAMGDEREVARAIQSMRKEKGLLPEDKVDVWYEVVKSGELTKTDEWGTRVGTETNTSISELGKELPQNHIKKKVTLSDGEVVLYMA